MSTGTAAGAYEYRASAVVGTRSRIGVWSGQYGWQVAPVVGHSVNSATVAASYGWIFRAAVGDNGEHLPDDRFRIIVQETRTREFTSRDLGYTNLKLQRALSGPCSIALDVNPNDTSVAGIYFKPWEQYIHVEITRQGKRKIWCSGIVQPSDIDEKTGILHLKAQGFAGYPKGLPWLENIDWYVNDVFDPVTEIWSYLQSYPNGDLHVEVFPAKSGIYMLPGYSYDGSTMSLNFYATFVRATDKLDCGDYIDAMARDVPFDYAERQQWNSDRTDVIKKIELGTPRLGDIQSNLAFVLNENVISAKPHTETQIDWVSDIGVTGWFPGVETSYELANADPNRLRRYLKEADAMLDSNERSQAWARRLLARRQTPAYWETITIDMSHPNAPFGTFDVGDTITVSGFMPWVGFITQDHKIMAISVDDSKNACQLSLKADGAFNYDSIFFPDSTTDIIANGGFDNNTQGWTASGPGWTWDGSQGASALGSVTVIADGTDQELYTQSYGVSDFQVFPLSVMVKAVDAICAAGADGIQLVAQFYDDDVNPTQAFKIDAVAAPSGLVPWSKLTGKVITPAGSTRVALRLHVDAAMTGGQVWFDDAALTL
jgi:hypothetical protein